MNSGDDGGTRRDDTGETHRLPHLLGLASQLLTGPLDVDAVVAATTAAPVDRLADGCTLFIRHDDRTLRAAASRHIDELTEKAVARLRESYGLVGPAKALHDAVVVGPVVIQPHQFPETGEQIGPALDALGPHPWLVVPLRDEAGRLLGGLRLVREGGFDGASITWAEEIARLCGPAIDRARRVTERSTALETLTQDLAPPSLPEVRGLEMEARQRAGTSAVGVGGDWYDVVEVNGRVVAAVGDAAGHGVDAAIAMNQARSAVRAFLGSGHSKSLLPQLDNFVDAMLKGGMITLCVLDIDARRRKAWVANAGHMPPILRSRGRTRRIDRGRTAPLGVGIPHRDGARKRLRFRKGDEIFLYTDGLVERRGETIDASLSRLTWVIDDAPQGDLGAACDHIVKHMAPADGYDDDVALMAIRFTRR